MHDELSHDPANHDENWIVPPLPKAHDAYVSENAAPGFNNVWTKRFGQGWVVRTYKHTPGNIRRAECIKNKMANFATGETP